jgi:hypothetical protein
MFKRKTVVIDDEDNIQNTPVKEKKSETPQPVSSINKDKVNLIKNQIKSSASKPKPEVVNKNRPVTLPSKKDTKSDVHTIITIVHREETQA